MRKLFNFVSIIFLMSSCSNYDQAFSDLIDQYPPPSNGVAYYLILPGQGCPGCITTGERFVKENHSKYTNLKIFLVEYYSKKMMSYKLGDSTLQSNQVIILDDTIIDKEKLKDKYLYPCVIKFKAGNILTVKWQSPENPNILNELKNEL